MHQRASRGDAQKGTVTPELGHAGGDPAVWIPPPVAKEKYETPRHIGFLIPNTPEVGELGLPFSLSEGGARCGNWTYGTRAPPTGPTFP